MHGNLSALQRGKLKTTDRLHKFQSYDAASMRKGLLRFALVGSLSLGVPAGAYSGSITGGVRFSDDPPKLPALKVTKDQDYCGETLPNETYVIESNGGLKNVVVFIESAPPGKAADAQKENFLYNDGCRFAPRVMAIQRGERLRVKSNDPKLHIHHGYLGNKTVFNLSLPFKGTSIDATSRIRQPGLGIGIGVRLTLSIFLVAGPSASYRKAFSRHRTAPVCSPTLLPAFLILCSTPPVPAATLSLGFDW